MRALRNIVAVAAMAIPLAGIAPLAAAAASSPSGPPSPHAAAVPGPWQDGPALRPASSPADASASGCTTDGSDGNVDTCIAINGSGLFVQSMQASATVLNSKRTIQVCLRGPGSVGTIGCTPMPGTTTFEPVAAGDTITFPWAPDGDVPPGDYCARTFRLNSDGTDTLIGQACKDVHS